MNVERILIVEKGNLCQYVSMIDLIVISSCYREDPEIFEYALAHERGHREIQKSNNWFIAIFHHVFYDWKFRFEFVTKDFEKYKKFKKLGKGREDLKIKELIQTMIYATLTIPTILFQFYAIFRMIFDKGLERLRSN